MIDWKGARELAHRIGLERALGLGHTVGLEPAGSLQHTGNARIIPLADAVGHTLRSDLVALAPLPGFSSSAMDGWVVAGAGPWTLGTTIHIGDQPSTVPLEPGTARAVTTGGALPPGATAVVRSEAGSIDSGVLIVAGRSPRDGEHMRRLGEEAGVGDLLVSAGSVLTPPRVALAAVAGHDSVEVVSLPRISLVLLGSEVETAGVPAPGRVRDAYSPQFPAVFASLGAGTVTVRRITDELELTVSAITAGDAALVVTTGGTARGSADHIRAALETLDATLLVDGVHMRPGHPAILARLPDGRLVLCLPGNPFAAMVVLASIGVPLLDGLLERPLRPLGSTTFQAAIENQGHHTQLVAFRACSGGAVPTSYQGSGMLRGLAEADGIAVVPPGGVAPGEKADTVPLPW